MFCISNITVASTAPAAGASASAALAVPLLSNSMLRCSCTPPHRLRGSEQAVWHGWSREAVRGWGQYLSLAVPSIVMICMK